MITYRTSENKKYKITNKIHDNAHYKIFIDYNDYEFMNLFNFEVFIENKLDYEYIEQNYDNTNIIHALLKFKLFKVFDFIKNENNINSYKTITGYSIFQLKIEINRLTGGKITVNDKLIKSIEKLRSK